MECCSFLISLSHHDNRGQVSVFFILQIFCSLRCPFDLSDQCIISFVDVLYPSACRSLHICKCLMLVVDHKVKLPVLELLSDELHALIVYCKVPFLGVDSSKWKYFDFTWYSGYFYSFSGAHLPSIHACHLLTCVLIALLRVITRYSVRGRVFLHLEPFLRSERLVTLHCFFAVFLSLNAFRSGSDMFVISGFHTAFAGLLEKPLSGKAGMISPVE